MIGISAIASYVPEGRLSNLERLDSLGMEESFVRDKLGVLEVSRRHADEETSDLGAEAIRRLLAETGKSLDEVECMVVCTQNPDGHGIPHTSAIIHGKLGLPQNCAAFDIGLGCSGYVYGLAVIAGFMQLAGLKRGILVTADPYSKIVDPLDRDTAAIFGDAATATWLEEGGLWQIGETQFGTSGAERAALHNDDGLLHMNGRAVFNFVLTRVAADITALLAKAGMTVENVDAFLFHQGSRYMVQQLALRLHVPLEKAPFEISAYGNTISSSIPLLLQARMAHAGSRLLLSGFGVGLSWASCILKKMEK